MTNISNTSASEKSLETHFFLYRVPQKKNATLTIIQNITSQRKKLGEILLHILLALFRNNKYAKNKVCILRNKVVIAVSVKHV